jgi:hypothetical protein
MPLKIRMWRAGRYRFGVPICRLRHGRAPALAALALALPATASAAYAPKLSVSIDPPSPAATSRVATTITQAGTETANKTVVVSIPAGFGVPVASLSRLPACTTLQMNARACPESTRIGSAQATAAVLGLLPVQLSGTVNWGGPTGDGRFVILVFLDNASLNQHLTLRGVISASPSGGFDTTFDGLPDQVTTSFTLVFDGGQKAVLTTPATCGDFTFKAAFTSQRGERAAAQAPVTISGCPQPAAAISRVRATRTRVSFRLGSPAVVRVLVKGPRSQVQLDRTLNARAGTTALRFRRALKPGTYRIAVTATADGASPVTVKKRVRIRRPA